MEVKAKFSIGEIVNVKGVTFGSAEIIDRIYSEANEEYTYSVQFEQSKFPASGYYKEDQLEYPEVVSNPSEYSWKIEVAEGVVIIRMFADGKEIQMGHGHIFHEGINGIAQATSYAAKKLYEKLNGGKV